MIFNRIPQNPNIVVNGFYLKGVKDNIVRNY